MDIYVITSFPPVPPTLHVSSLRCISALYPCRWILKSPLPVSQDKFLREKWKDQRTCPLGGFLKVEERKLAFQSDVSNP